MAEENQVAEEQTSNPSEPVTQEVNWKESLPDDLRDNPSLKSIQDVPGLAKSFIHAQKMVGADFIVAQGIEAGGHRGVFNQENLDEKIKLDNLINKILENVSLPVVAAGGIMEGKHIKRVLKIGAKAAQLGTAFLTCDEAGTSKIHKYYLLNEQKRKTKITKAFSGRMARGINNKFIEEMTGKKIFPFPIQNTVTMPLRKVSQNKNNGEFINLWAGTNFNKVRDLSAKELIQRLSEEFNAVI